MENIRPIRNDDDLAWAIAEVTPYFENPPAVGSRAADRFDVLSDLIEAYENRHHAVELPEPIALLHTYMAMSGRTQADLAKLFGSRSRASEILNRKRPLTMEMVRKLHQEWKLPADCLVQPCLLESA